MAMWLTTDAILFTWVFVTSYFQHTTTTKIRQQLTDRISLLVNATSVYTTCKKISTFTESAHSTWKRIHTHTDTHTQTHTHTYIHTHTYMHACTHTNTFTQTRTHTHTHTSPHTYVQTHTKHQLKMIFKMSFQKKKFDTTNIKTNPLIWEYESPERHGCGSG